MIFKDNTIIIFMIVLQEAIGKETQERDRISEIIFVEEIGIEFTSIKTIVRAADFFIDNTAVWIIGYTRRCIRNIRANLGAICACIDITKPQLPFK